MIKINKISPDIQWALGLIETDGYIGYNLNNGKHGWLFIVKVSLKSYNARSIYKLKSIFGIGKIHRDSEDMVTWKVTRFDQIKEIMLPIFEQYELRGIKAHEVAIMREALNIYESNITREEKTVILKELKSKSTLLCKSHNKNITPFWQKHLNIKDKDAVYSVEDYKNLVPSQKILTELLDPDWLAGFIEGDGSLQINNRLQNVFELGQKYNIFLVLCIHKYFGITADIKIRPDLSYTMFTTKHPNSLELIEKTLTGRMRGIKSFELRLWKYSRATKLKSKKEKAKILLNKISCD